MLDVHERAMARQARAEAVGNRRRRIERSQHTFRLSVAHQTMRRAADAAAAPGERARAVEAATTARPWAAIVELTSRCAVIRVCFSNAVQRFQRKLLSQKHA